MGVRAPLSALKILIVALGSAIGGALRYAVSVAALRIVPAHVPAGTLTVNVAGSFLIALLMAFSASRPGAVSEDLQLFLAAGVMGGFTTYSAFNHATIVLARDQGLGPATINVTVTLIGCILAGVAGLALGQRFGRLGS